jgi:hypothetical protein
MRIAGYGRWQAMLRRDPSGSALFNTTAWVRDWERRVEQVWTMHAAGLRPSHVL